MPDQPKFRPVDLLGSIHVTADLASFTLSPPVLTRLEPNSVSGDPSFGARAAVADPLWFLGRQWQLGELLGEDAASPVSVAVTHRSLPVTAWAPAGGILAEDRAQQPRWRPWPEGAVLDELVEDVPGIGYEEGLRWRADTGAQLVEMLTEAGLPAVVKKVLAAHPLRLAEDQNDPEGRYDPAAQRLHDLLAGRVPDGGTLRAQLRAAAGPGGAPQPPWVTAAAHPVTEEWLAWVEGAADSGGAWTTPRLEHRFRLRFGHGEDAVVVAADSFGSGTARWHHFEWVPGSRPVIEGDQERSPVSEQVDVVLATPLRYPGMPADRYWQLEDGSVDVAAIEAQAHDLARLCLAEFALATGDDWLVVPVDGRVGALNQVLKVTWTDTFGELHEVTEGAPERRARGFSMFEVTTVAGRALPGVLLPPVAHSPHVGAPVEEVAFLRDETANMAWAVERIVPGRNGDGRRRTDEPQPEPPTFPDDVGDGDLLYELMRAVPRHWIPLVPISTGYASVALRKGAMLMDGEAVEAASWMLSPTPLTFPQEEVAREGLLVQACPKLARRANGTYARWVGHRVRTGSGEGASYLAFDTARTPPLG